MKKIVILVITLLILHHFSFAEKVNIETVRTIAEKLFISEETVISHRKHLLSKFKAHNSAELIRIAMENNLL
jgi:FixJ family two-component response regulator